MHYGRSIEQHTPQQNAFTAEGSGRSRSIATTLSRGHPVEIVETFSRLGKRIALMQDRDGEVFELFSEQLD
ncbi:hypothetical protein [Sulfurimonas sp. HSL3-7]|uniref:hypothetical protein n=1 Tax=Sulfonitrofixus jiaomeiensis TaxID=3131938 RepID=UPI0031F9B46A